MTSRRTKADLSVTELNRIKRGIRKQKQKSSSELQALQNNFELGQPELRIRKDLTPDTSGGRKLGTSALPFNSLILLDQDTGDSYELTVESGSLVITLV